MNRVMKKIWKLPLIVWVLIAFGVGIGVGALMYTLVIPGTITILPPAEGTYEIKIYSDAECTQEITSIDFGEAHAGDYVHSYFYLKNTGTATISIIDKRIEISGVGIIKGTLTNNLEPQQVRYIDLTFTVPASAGTGTYAVEVKLECYA